MSKFLLLLLIHILLPTKQGSSFELENLRQDFRHVSAQVNAINPTERIVVDDSQGNDYPQSKTLSYHQTPKNLGSSRVIINSLQASVAQINIHTQGSRSPPHFS
ncbi:MAG: hypothetical protein KC478_01255 [Bacteriovoracaceae bacterium]|nr:hypothetical protein [Bacteriovoracaceae bacterium]